ncbi:hypothetical protein V6N13_063022 [Hibiscus sabdariffa]
MGRSTCFQTSHIFGFFLLLVFMESKNKVESQVEPPPPPHDEIRALHEIAAELGKKDWNFSENPCNNKSSWYTPPLPPNVPQPTVVKNSSVTCNCSLNGGQCHIYTIRLSGLDLSGVLPRSLSKLPYLKEIVLFRNFLSGTIPREWATMKLEFVSLSSNRLSGPVPSYLGNITTLTFLSLDDNLFSGTIPPELGKLVNMETLILNANYLTGELPPALANLVRMKQFRISSNYFTGKLPNIFQSWKQLQILEMQASGFEGPFPSTLSALNSLVELRISDLHGEGSRFPNLQNMKNLSRLVLRSCNISGPIPPYIWEMPLGTLDLSFNKLEGNFSGNEKTLFTQIDLSYNNISASLEPTSCTEHLNLFKSFSGGNNLGQQSNCLKNFPCSKDYYSVHINCGGGSTTIGGITYDADEDLGGPAKYFPLRETWETSSSGYFWDTSVTSKDYIAQNVSILKMNNSELYTRARLSPLSLTYYIRCLANGSYTVKLHFAEIVIRDNSSFQSLGRRVFDVYIQEKLELKDFNIKNAAKAADKEVIRSFKTVVRDKTLSIRFHWAGKGTTATPKRGIYGPLISAISVESDSKPQFSKVWNTKMKMVVGAVVSAMCLIVLTLGILWRRGYFGGGKMSREQVLRGLDLQAGFFTFIQMKAATNNFDPAKKIGEGGFGSVYKGVLLDGTIIAIKQLSTISRQGDREFLNELGMISGLQHPNLVRLYGCCVEGTNLLLVYEYMENNSLARALSDVYSFGIVTLEIVAGKNNSKHRSEEGYVCLQDLALVLQQTGRLMELVDSRLETEFNEEEAIRMMKVALLCTNPSPAPRPIMSEVVNMLEGRTPVPEVTMDLSIFRDEERFGALREQLNQIQSHIMSSSQPSESAAMLQDL